MKAASQNRLTIGIDLGDIAGLPAVGGPKPEITPVTSPPCRANKPSSEMANPSPMSPPAIRSPLYTPFQVRLASFLGGPFAAVYTLRHNFKSLQNDRGARLTLYWGSGFVVVLFAVIPLLPSKFPNSVIPLAYSLAAGGIASSKQLSKEAILGSNQYVRCGGWNVALVSLVAFVAFCAILVPFLFGLDYFGQMRL
jgi:hypothetical protein